jgi:hypothetical protein
MVELAELQTRMATAIANNDVKAIEEVAAEIVKSKSERRKAEVEQAQAEAEALAGKREELAIKIHNAVRELKLDGQLKGMKAWGFTYKVDRANPSEPNVTYASVALSTLQIKARKAGTGGGAGKTKDEFGMSLSEVFEKYATAEDRTNLADAEAKDKIASKKLGKSTNSNAWRVKNEVKKDAIKAGLLAPAK